MSVEDIVDGLAIIQQKRGRMVDQGDVEMLALAIKELRKGRPAAEQPLAEKSIGVLRHEINAREAEITRRPSS